MAIYEDGKRAFEALKRGDINEINLYTYLTYLSNGVVRLRAHDNSLKKANEDARKEIAELMPIFRELLKERG